MSDATRPEWADDYPGYPALVASWGYDVLDLTACGSYQGDYVGLLRDGSRYGTIVFGYGSCSGCDALQDVTPWSYDEDDPADWTDFNRLVERLRDDVRWHGSATESAAELRGRLESADEHAGDWYLYDDEVRDVLRRYAERLETETDVPTS